MTNARSAEFPEAGAVSGGQAGPQPAGPAAVAGGTGRDRPGMLLVLELVIAGTEPLSGTVAVAGSERRHEFHGWIDLMSAISLLHEDAREDRSRPG